MELGSNEAVEFLLVIADASNRENMNTRAHAAKFKLCFILNRLTIRCYPKNCETDFYETIL